MKRKRRRSSSGVPRRLRTDEAVYGLHRVAFGAWPTEGRYMAEAEAAERAEESEVRVRRLIAAIERAG